MLPKKGTMRTLKKILGIVIGIAGFGMVFGINAILNILSQFQLLFGVILLIIAYFDVISGRQL